MKNVTLCHRLQNLKRLQKVEKEFTVVFQGIKEERTWKKTMEKIKKINLIV